MEWISKIRANLEYKFSDFPSKFLVRYYIEKDVRFAKKLTLKNSKAPQIAHMYAYDSTITNKDLSLIFKVYRVSREKSKKLLWKYVRIVRKQINE